MREIEGAATGSRCTRADCTSLREELELLRGDLLEIEGENEQLHEQLATFQSEASVREAHAQQKLLEKNTDIVHLNETVASLTAQLQQQLNKHQEVERAITAPEKAVTKPFDQEFEAVKAQNEALETKLKELQGQVQREATAGLTAQRQVAQIAEDSKDKRSELYTTLKENELLRDEVVELQEMMKKMTVQVKDYQVSITAMQDQLEAYRDAVDEQTLEITQLHAKVEELELEKLNVEAKLIEMDEKESDVDTLMNNAKTKFEMEKAVLIAELDELKRKLKQQQMLHEQQQQQFQESVRAVKEEEAEDNVRGTANVGVEDLEKQLDMLQELRVRDKSTILELNQRILQQQSDLESLLEHLDVETVVENAVETALQKQKARLESLDQENATLKRRLKEQRGLVQDLELRQGIVEKQLVEAKEWNAKYEQQAGLEDVVKYQKKLRSQLEQQQQMNVKLRQQLNEQEEAAGNLNVAFERLKTEVGKPANFGYDDLVIADHLKGQLAINEAVMKQMEIQIQELEAERLRFLKKLRDQARLAGHKLYEEHGLTTDQWSAVEEFIDRVKQTPEVAKRLLQANCEPVEVREEDLLARRQKEDKVAIEELERKLDISSEENGLLLKDIERLQNELEEAQSQPLASVVIEPLTGPDDGRGELIRTLEAAKTKSQRQEGVIYHLRAEIASLRKECEQKSVKKIASPVSISAESRSQPQEASHGKIISDSPAQVYAGTQTSPRAHPASKSGESWSGQTDNIALVVAKAIEAQFAILQAQANSLLPLTASDTPAKVDIGINPSSTLTEDRKTVDPLKVVSRRSPKARESVDNVAFDSEEEMIQHVDFLRELNVCLDELVAVEAHNEELQQQLHQHEGVFQSLMDQHTVLYQHFFQMHAQYANAEILLRQELDQVKEDNKDYKIKCERYEAGMHLLDVQNQQNFAGSLISGNEAQLRSEVIDLTRRNAAYGVNEERLKRKYQQLHAEWRSSTEHNKLLQREWSEMEKTLKYRVLYLETWKQGADEMMERMEKTLEKSVLREFADKQQQAINAVLKKYNAVNQSYVRVHAKYLELYDLPTQLSRSQYQVTILRAQNSAKGAAAGETGSDTRALRGRIAELESELDMQVKRVKELEEASYRRLFHDDELVQSPVMNKDSEEDNELRNENKLLYERINEVEQLYESLALECAKYKDIASLAASQANVLAKRATQEQGNREQEVEHLRELMASSEDHAIVGELQHQLMQIKATYQQFLVQYDLVTEAQQQTLLKNQRLELEMEKKAQELSVVREKSSDKVQVLENAIEQIKERDWTARNTKWETFRKRLDALEGEIQVEQQRRKQLEKDLEDNQVQLPSLDLRQQRGNQSEVGRLKSRVDALETRERLLMGQLEAAMKATGSKEREIMLHAELTETKTLNEDLMRQLEAIQARVSELLQLNGGLEAEKREIRCKYEDLELELQHVRTGGEGVGWHQHSNQRDFDHSSSHSPLMHQKVGLYEKDQAELQQAAQVTIASLKQLVEEKNTLIDEYQRKLAVIRASSAQDKAQDRLETTQLTKKLYEENQRMIGQLKEAMSTISSMERSGKSKQALQAAQERHDHVLQEWKQAEIALESAKQSIRELQIEREVLRNERDLAEARAGEALEEIVLLKERLTESEKHSQKLGHQVEFIKRDVSKKEEKLKLLRDAIIKLKEEFLKAEDRHAIEIAKAQHTINQDFKTRKQKEKARREEEEKEWQEEKTRLQSQVQLLREQLTLLKKKQNQQLRRKKQMHSEEKQDQSNSSEAEVQMLKEEIERLKRLLKEKVVSEARAVEELEKKIKVLQAQNLALREASSHAPAAPAILDDTKTKREQLESERKLQRRVDILMLRLKEKQADVTSKDSELERCSERISELEAALQSHQARSDQDRLAQMTAAPTVPTSVKDQQEELKRQNAFLQETLILKRKEWEESFTAQMERYEGQLQRLRRRLVQHGLPSTDVDSDDATDDTRHKAQLQREEQYFLVGQEIQEELLVLGEELRSKEQDMVVKDTKLLELELEVESLRMEYKRVQRQNQGGGGLPDKDEAPKQRRGVKGGAGRGSTWTTQERLELEEVIENMKKVIEKLRAENEKLKKVAAKQASVSPERVELMRRKLKEQKEAREQLLSQLEKLQCESSELKKDKVKLQQKLRAKAATSSSSRVESNAFELQLKEKDRQLLEAEQELAELRHQILQLELQVEHSSIAAGNVQQQQEQNERIKDLQEQVLELEDENAKLTNELAAFDEDFFEEIEDLKYKYAQAVRDKRKLEKRLAHNAGALSPSSNSSRRSRS
ncbi:Centrosomal protein [Phytophthora citrophthora]|uniref:Centrosomal protein n=1 Tax=Phytophthora citrophthora TaxID=4793 RepID=A0AAD9LNJ9_9STRA|nr:Centrosomal protein [Phytophthora citrophthora]